MRSHITASASFVVATALLVGAVGACSSPEVDASQSSTSAATSDGNSQVLVMANALAQEILRDRVNLPRRSVDAIVALRTERGLRAFEDVQDLVTSLDGKSPGMGWSTYQFLYDYAGNPDHQPFQLVTGVVSGFGDANPADFAVYAFPLDGKLGDPADTVLGGRKGFYSTPRVVVSPEGRATYELAVGGSQEGKSYFIVGYAGASNETFTAISKVKAKASRTEDNVISADLQRSKVTSPLNPRNQDPFSCEVNGLPDNDDGCQDDRVMYQCFGGILFVGNCSDTGFACKKKTNAFGATVPGVSCAVPTGPFNNVEADACFGGVALTLFSDKNYQGQHVTICAGSYPDLSQLMYAEVGANGGHWPVGATISSFYLTAGPNPNLRLCHDPGFGGGCLDLKGEDRNPNLAEGTSFNDQIRSIAF